MQRTSVIVTLGLALLGCGGSGSASPGAEGGESSSEGASTTTGADGHTDDRSTVTTGSGETTTVDESSGPASTTSTGQTSTGMSTECAVESLDLLRSTGEVELVGGPFPCETADSDEFYCAWWAATVQPAEEGKGPVDDDTLDDGMSSHDIILSVRAPLDAACDTRWVMFDSGGTGRGYAQTFGGVAPGRYEPEGAFGDDLIRWYNEAGYVTVDIAWECTECTDAQAQWVAPPGQGGRGWYRELNGAGYIGAASRARAIYEWASEQTHRRLCSHSHSSGSGRAAAVLTRYSGAPMFDTVTFDGGPVWAYIPWYCGTDEGPLGPRQPAFDLESGVGFLSIFDCAMTQGSNAAACSYDRCSTHAYDGDRWLANSNFWLASDREFGDLDMHVVLGETDGSPAQEHARLWLTGATAMDGTPIPPWSARSITLTQGYCPSADGTYLAASPNGGLQRPCSDWALSSFGAVVGVGPTGFDERLEGVPHATASARGGAEVIFERGVSTCEP